MKTLIAFAAAFIAALGLAMVTLAPDERPLGMVLLCAAGIMAAIVGASVPSKA